ncbi:MAG: PepSY domain-containing protein [Gammaproteobacteria bacterium]|nr:PepSY domain-containing protein [Gammaproteobacteria bacterium]
MNNLFSITFILLIAMAVVLPLHTAYADDDYIEARRLHESGEILPLENILEKIRLTYPGKVLEIELDKKAGKIVYEVEILGKDGVVREIYINAKTGQLLYEKKDD